jgi:predicted RNase H-like HicB family nuclease
MSATTTKTDEKIEEIKARPYQRNLVPENDGTWFISIAEFPGCISVGDTPEEAMEMIDDGMTQWLRVMIEDGDTIPEPQIDHQYSGKTVVRLGKSLHRSASEAAERDGVSLNLFIVTSVARAAGARLESLHRV